MTQPNLFTQELKEGKAETKAQQHYLDHNNIQEITTFIDVYSEFNQIIRNVTLKENVVLIDLEKELPKKAKIFYDTVHVTKEGSILQAKIIAQNFIHHIN